MGSLPPFDGDGLLPPGDYPLSIIELASSSLVIGPPNSSAWDAEWRAQLVQNLGVMAGHLRAIGIFEIFADGSFAEEKPHPSDIEG
jgi:hypothetical protein